jgi:hypothetical protein
MESINTLVHIPRYVKIKDVLLRKNVAEEHLLVFKIQLYWVSKAAGIAREVWIEKTYADFDEFENNVRKKLYSSVPCSLIPKKDYLLSLNKKAIIEKYIQSLCAIKMTFEHLGPFLGLKEEDLREAFDWDVQQSLGSIKVDERSVGTVKSSREDDDDETEWSFTDTKVSLEMLRKGPMPPPLPKKPKKFKNPDDSSEEPIHSSPPTRQLPVVPSRRPTFKPKGPVKSFDSDSSTSILLESSLTSGTRVEQGKSIMELLEISGEEAPTPADSQRIPKSLPVLLTPPTPPPKPLFSEKSPPDRKLKPPPPLSVLLPSAAESQSAIRVSMVSKPETDKTVQWKPKGKSEDKDDSDSPNPIPKAVISPRETSLLKPKPRFGSEASIPRSELGKKLMESSKHEFPKVFSPTSEKEAFPSTTKAKGDGLPRPASDGSLPLVSEHKSGAMWERIENSEPAKKFTPTVKPDRPAPIPDQFKEHEKIVPARGGRPVASHSDSPRKRGGLPKPSSPVVVESSSSIGSTEFCTSCGAARKHSQAKFCTDCGGKL